MLLWVHERLSLPTISSVIVQHNSLLPSGPTDKVLVYPGDLDGGRTVEVKKAFYKATAEGIHTRTGLRKEDVWISLVDVKHQDGSFGNSEMQYAPTE